MKSQHWASAVLYWKSLIKCCFELRHPFCCRSFWEDFVQFSIILTGSKCFPYSINFSMHWMTSSAFHILIALSKRVTQGLLENSQGGLTKVPNMTSSLLRELQDRLLSSHYWNTCNSYSSPFFFLFFFFCISGWLHGHCLCSISPKEEKERSVSQSVYLNLLQALKFKPKYILNWIYFFQGSMRTS